MTVLEVKEFEQSIQELVADYDFNIDINIRIFLGTEKKSHLIRSNNNFKKNEVVIKFDPFKQLTYKDYRNCYYCNTRKDLIELVNFFIENSNLYLDTCPESEDVLDQKETIRTDLYSLDEE